MLKFIFRRFMLLLLTMLIVSVAVFCITQFSPGDIARNVLGAFVTPQQEASFVAQNGLDQPLYLRYVYWLIGDDWLASRRVGMPLRRLVSKDFVDWWAVKPDGDLVRWRLEGDNLIATEEMPDGSRRKYTDNGRWHKNPNGTVTAWGVDDQNRAVEWQKGSKETAQVFIIGKGWMQTNNAPIAYLPLSKGFLRGDFGLSLRTGRSVNTMIFTRFRNSMVLAGSAFAVVMPLALLLGLIAGLLEGTWTDRILSTGGMMFSVIPEFAIGIFLILILAVWLQWVPGAAVFGTKAPWQDPSMLILPVMTLTMIELGYVLRITRASMVEVMRSPYIRTAHLKGLPYRRVVVKHAVRNAMMAPITVIMLHVNWLIGGIVVTEVVFGYPGLGAYLLSSALYKDVNALEAGSMMLVVVAVSTQLIADILYTFLNPRIRYQ